MILQLFRSLLPLERRIFFGAAVLCSVALLATIWSVFITSTVITPARGGEYTEGMVGQPVALNPMQIGSTPLDQELIPVLFADLATLSHNIATSTTGKVWVVTLKDELVWSDGKSITADDVLFTVHTIQRPESDSPLWASWQGITAERVSQREVRFTLKSAYSYFADSLKTLRIAPAHAFESIPVTNIRLSDYNLKPISSGPYLFAGFEKRTDGFITEYHLAANNDYAGERALIENVNIRFFPSYNDALMAFNRKQIDGLGGIDASSVAELKINHRLYQLPTPQYYAVFFNQTAHPALKDKNVRSALVHAIDREAIVQTALGGFAVPLMGPIPAGMEGYDALALGIPTSTPTLAPSSTEIAAGLAKLGWNPAQDGVRTRGSGKTAIRLEFELTVPDLPALVSIAELIRDDWQRIGVRAAIKAIPPTEIQETAVRTRSYQMLLFGNALRGNSDLFSFWDSSQRFDPGLNFSLYSNSAVDKLITAARTGFATDARLTALSKIQAQITVDRPAIFLFSPLYLYAAPTALGGVNTTVALPQQERLSTIHTWFLKTDRVFK